MLFDYFLTAVAADYFYIMRYGEDGFAVVRAAAARTSMAVFNFLLYSIRPPQKTKHFEIKHFFASFEIFETRITHA